MCEYLAGACDRETLASEIDAYWQKQKQDNKHRIRCGEGLLPTFLFKEKDMTKKKNKKLINVLQFAGFGFPALFIWMSVVIIPFIYGIWITFTDWNGLAMHINYVGLQNYIDVFKDATFVSSFVKTVIYAFFTVLASNIVGFALHWL